MSTTLRYYLRSNLLVCLVVLLQMYVFCTIQAFGQREDKSESAEHSSTKDCDPSKDIILYWNKVMLDANAADAGLAVQDQPGPCRGSRAFAIISVAMFDAWNSIHNRYTPYLTKLSGYDSASEDAAISVAARDTLMALYPQQSTRFESAYRAVMRDMGKSKRKSLGIQLGSRIAEAILLERSNDNSNSTVTYQPKPQSGYHQPDPLHPNQGFYAPHWGAVDPFAISDMQSFLGPPPPALNSHEYADAFNEVKNLGGDGVTTPTLRTEEQSVIGV